MEKIQGATDAKRQTFLEELKKGIAQKIESAIKNPISGNRLNELVQEMDEAEDRFLATGEIPEDTVVRQKEIEAEIFKSSAVVETIPEFRELLEQLCQRFHEPRETVTQLLAHENAHSNTSEQLDEDIVGYATVFTSGETGRLESAQPVHISRARSSWSPSEILTKRIKVVGAPLEYKSVLSGGDIEDLKKTKVKLDLVPQGEATDRHRIEELKKEIDNLLEKSSMGRADNNE